MKEPTTPNTNNYYTRFSYIGGIDGADVPGQAMYGYAIIGANGVEVSLEGNVGLAYEGKVYAGNGESVSIGLSGPEGYNPSAGYNASAGTLTPNGTTWTLVMPQEDVTISPDIAPHGIAATNISPNSADIIWEGYYDSYALRYREIPTLLKEGFEGGTVPQGWTIEGDNQDPATTWRVGVGDHYGTPGTHSGDYNAMITHKTNDQVTYLVTPALDLSEYGSVELSFWYVNRKWGNDIDEFAVCYRIGNREWNVLWSTAVNHDRWTNQTVELTGLGDNCQIGFRCTDHYGYGVGLDDIVVFYMTHSEWITLSEAESPQAITGLTPETEYEVKVQGVCGGEATEWSEAATFTTLEATTFTKEIVGYGESSCGYYLIATPVMEAVTPTAENGFLTNVFDLYHFDQSEALEWRNYQAAPFVLENGKGYLYASQEGTTLTFIGASHAATEPVEVPLTYDQNASFAGWNLVGNPFPVAAYADRSYYKMNEAGRAIEPVAVSSSTPIEACTGVMVQAETTGETVTFSRTAEQNVGNRGNIQISVAKVPELVEGPTRSQAGVSTGSRTVAAAHHGTTRKKVISIEVAFFSSKNTIKQLKK